MSQTFRGDHEGAALKLAIVVSRFREDVTTRLLEGSQRAASELGVEGGNVDIAWVPGAFELPLAARTLAETNKYDAVVCLGAVLKGETSHDQYISHEVARGIGQAMQETGVPIVFGVITPHTLEQAFARSGGDKADKGYEAVETAVEMANLLSRLKG